MRLEGNPIQGILCWVLAAYTLVLFARAIWSFFPPPRHPILRRIYGVLLAITEPILRPLRKVIEPVRMGAIGFDVSFLVVVIVLMVLRQALC